MALLQDEAEISNKLDETWEYPQNDSGSYERGVLCKSLADNRRRIVVVSTFLFLGCGAVVAYAAFVFLYDILYNNGMRMHTQKMMLGLAVGLVCTAVPVMFLCTLICLASYRQKLSLMRRSVTACRILLLIEVSVAILALCYQTSVKKDAESLADWRGFVFRYHQSVKLHLEVDSIQTKLKCCGFSSYEDWEHNPYFACTSTTIGHCGVPASCCKGKSPAWNCSHRIRSQTKGKQRSEVINMRGCLDLMIAWTKYNLILLSFACLFLACSQAMLFSVTGGFLKQAHLDQTWPDESVELNLDNVELRGTNILKTTRSESATRRHFAMLQQRDWKAKFLCHAWCTGMKQAVVTRQGTSSIQEV